MPTEDIGKVVRERLLAKFDEGFANYTWTTGQSVVAVVRVSTDGNVEADVRAKDNLVYIGELEEALRDSKSAVEMALSVLRAAERRAWMEDSEQ